jgi:hypothetical protein
MLLSMSSVSGLSQLDYYNIIISGSCADLTLRNGDKPGADDTANLEVWDYVAERKTLNIEC